MKRVVIAIISVLTLAFVDVARADQVRFFSVLEDGIEYSQDIHYTVLTLEGDKVAEDTVENPYGVTINDLPLGTYFISAEQPSTGYFGSRRVDITGEEFRMVRGEWVKDDENKLLLGPDGLTKYVQDYPYADEISRAQEFAGQTGCGCEAPVETSCQAMSSCQTCALPCCGASYCCGISPLGAAGLIGGLVPAIVVPLIKGTSAEAK